MDTLEQVIGLGHRPPEEIIPELPDPPGDELSEREQIGLGGTDTDELEEDALDEDESEEFGSGPPDPDVPFDIEALDDYPSGDQDA
jgi:hypothetical protein